MLIHLEAGICASGTDKRDISEYVYESSDGYYCTDGSPFFPFKCTQCSSAFSTISGLVQHTEARPECAGQMENEKYLRGLLNDLKFRIIEV